MDIAITKMSTKGQIVIPQEMRSRFKPGEKIVLIENKDQIIMKKVSDFDKNLEEDLEFARRTEEGIRRIEQGQGIRMSFDDLEKEIEKW